MCRARDYTDFLTRTEGELSDALHRVLRYYYTTRIEHILIDYSDVVNILSVDTYFQKNNLL